MCCIGCAGCGQKKFSVLLKNGVSGWRVFREGFYSATECVKGWHLFSQYARLSLRDQKNSFIFSKTPKLA